MISSNVVQIIARNALLRKRNLNALPTFVSSMKMSSRASTCESAASRWTPAAPASPASPLDFNVRIPSYNYEKFPLSAVAHISEHPRGGFTISPYDHEITSDLRKAVLMESSHLRVHLEPGGALRVVPMDRAGEVAIAPAKKARRVALVENKALFDEEAFGSLDFDEVLAPKSSKLYLRLSKAWAPVHTKGASARAAERRAVRQSKREATAALASSSLEGELSAEMLSRLERLAAHNKKSMRQLIKRATESEWSFAMSHEDPPLKPSW